ncbi:hypothetical protein [Mesorhizobium sp. 1M-11]|uniref:hypothetical protein n=1 Tax=Mesorhizobium sp. 1M-11 TaxID=1529006 RepID=UPI0006C768C1|nr:hypothetical protein [Mesorhizobium sp. 1M-11]
MKSVILAPSQRELAGRLINVLNGSETGDGLTAMASIIAATINDRAAGDADVATADAAWYADLILTTVQAGLRGELLRNDEAPIDVRYVL